jgi:hypothetical protein
MRKPWRSRSHFGIAVTLLEPGAVRSDGVSGASNHTGGSPYEPVVPRLATARGEQISMETVAVAIGDAIDLRDPPLRIPIGTAAQISLAARESHPDKIAFRLGIEPGIVQRQPKGVLPAQVRSQVSAGCRSVRPPARCNTVINASRPGDLLSPKRWRRTRRRRTVRPAHRGPGPANGASRFLRYIAAIARAICGSGPGHDLGRIDTDHSIRDPALI